MSQNIKKSWKIKEQIPSQQKKRISLEKDCSWVQRAISWLYEKIRGLFESILQKPKGKSKKKVGNDKKNLYLTGGGPESITVGSNDELLLSIVNSKTVLGYKIPLIVMDSFSLQIVTRLKLSK